MSNHVTREELLAKAAAVANLKPGELLSDEALFSPEDVGEWQEAADLFNVRLMEIDEDEQAAAFEQYMSMPDPQPQTQPAPGADVDLARALVPDPVVEGLLNRRTINEVIGDSGVGKTTLLTLMMACISQRERFGGHLRTVGGLCVYFAGEDPEGVYKQRAAMARQWGVEDPEQLFIIVPEAAALTNTSKLKEQLKAIKAKVGDRGVPLIVLDSKAAHMVKAERTLSSGQVKTLDENNNDDQHFIGECAMRLARSTNSAVVFIPHIAKAMRGVRTGEVDGRGGSAAKAIAYKTFSLSGIKTPEDDYYLHIAPGKVRGGGIRQPFCMKIVQIPIFSPELEAGKRAEVEAKFSGCKPPREDGFCPRVPDFMRVGVVENLMLDPEEVKELAGISEDETSERKAGRPKSDGLSAQQEEVYSIILEQMNGRALQSDIVNRAADILGVSESSIRTAVRQIVLKGYANKSGDGKDTLITVKNAPVPPLAQR